jgi:hypothetical protein
MKRAVCALLAALMLLLTACGGKGSIDISDVYGSISEKMSLGKNELSLDGDPAVSGVLMPKASGKKVYKNNKASMDASNTRDGYVMIAYTASTSKRVKVLITGPSAVRYTYNLTPGKGYVTFPLSDGSGKYTIGVYRQTDGEKYAVELSKTMKVKLDDEFAPFLRPNQYVNYSADSQAVAIAKKLTANCGTDLEKITAVYNYVISHLSYDYYKAETVQSGYLSDIDAVLKSGKGICYDYAAVMTAMLRSQGVPTKLVVGYTSDMYHAWINVYTKSDGWVDGVIYFDGTTWKLMDPTFASSSGSNSQIMQYIGNSGNYTAKYLY